MKPLFPGSWRELVSRPVLSSLVLGLLGLPVFAQAAPLAFFSTNPNPAIGGDSLTVQILDQTTGEITGWNWDLGDGTSSIEQNPVHTYGLGVFGVTLTVTGPGGSSSFTNPHAVDVVPSLFGFIFAPPPLSSMTVPLPDELSRFVKDRARAIELGKALFWDTQLGSDGLTACASCHFHAGTDNRAVNTLHPGHDGLFGPLPSGAVGGPNYALKANDFPFHKFLDPDQGDVLIADTNDRVGTTGVTKKAFTGIAPGSAIDLGLDQPDGTFQVGGVNTLRVTGRQAPTTLGAVFFQRIFWDGRADHFFNGRSIWGNRDPSASVLQRLPDDSLTNVRILLNNAAAASQAVGPPLSDVEMSWAGRNWLDLGRKMVGRAPLANQFVDPSDGALGSLANLAGNGLDPALTYADMIAAAFQDEWWASSQLSGGFTQMEANFSLFFGLAILAYEATLIPDQAPYDAFSGGDEFALSDSEKRGLGIFLGRGQCIDCHATSMFAGGITSDILSHSDPNEGEALLERMNIQNALAVGGLTFATNPGPGELPLTFNPFSKNVVLRTPGRQIVASARTPAGSRCPPAGETVIPMRPGPIVLPSQFFQGTIRIRSDGACGLRVDVDFEWNGPPAGNYLLRFGGVPFTLTMPPATLEAIYDNGFYNIGVRPTTEDPGIGNNGPFGPLSMTKRIQSGEDVGFFSGAGVPGPHARIAVNGSFKAPTLRNIELTGPYMHNGGMATLEQVVEFYTRGTDFSSVNRRDLDPRVTGIFPMTAQDKADLVALLKAFTDPRVRFERAPFDHPELPLKSGHVGDETSVIDDGTGNAVPSIEIVPATGAAGGPPLQPFEASLGAAVTADVIGHHVQGVELALFLDKSPTVEVALELSVPGAPADITPSMLTFTPENWRTAQHVMVGAVGDGTGRKVSVRVLSLDPEFGRLLVPDIALDPASNDDSGGDPGSATPVPGGAGSMPTRL